MSDLCLVATMLAKMQLAENNAVDLPTPPDRLSPSPKTFTGQKSALHPDLAHPEASFPELSGRSIDPQGHLCQEALLHVLKSQETPGGETPMGSTNPSSNPSTRRVMPVAWRSGQGASATTASTSSPTGFTTTSFTPLGATGTAISATVATSAASGTAASGTAASSTAAGTAATGTATPSTLTAAPARSGSDPGAIALRSEPGLNLPGLTLPPNSGQATPRFTANYQGPASGPQLYQQRRASLQAGRLYTRLPSNSFRSVWANATQQPNSAQWQLLLAAEARAVTVGQGSSPLSIVVGDSLSLWMPQETLPQNRLWLNQGISGDTTTGILQRLHFFRNARPDTIYVMAGINDLLQGASDATVVSNLERIVWQLHQDHPQAEIVLQSILPTDNRVPNSRIRNINRQLIQIAQREGVHYLDLHPYFADDRGNLRRDFTTDGVHLTALGYGVWQSFWQQAQGLFAQGRSGNPV
ncbi:MAG: GDSL-type esterase/lipase family protein [Prochlorothrix sp.]